jgi:hypothetical protein
LGSTGFAQELPFRQENDGVFVQHGCGAGVFVQSDFAHCLDGPTLKNYGMKTAQDIRPINEVMPLTSDADEILFTVPELAVNKARTSRQTSQSNQTEDRPDRHDAA